ncbi:FMN adenylyltransferase /riboflavin kinase [Mesocricetibacter intestinalis]|uniref:Riboflavin biosynthesis protein n=1 Tax=Mesocricetibacter intestinalis TaxID=1521930 RepID=A0A4R6VBI9_9PAST|nr:bifunctional riboflavin kinase/FAD synthetase [Mesocricetibacter intestinalis]TDQ59638.1 FMN adenylyltransferase /riboflavin kinase [Mesocricetibacter intestinalis]
MQLIRGMHNLQGKIPGCALTIGNFDGVHLGHQAILRRLRRKADELQLPMAVMLFEPQPREYFSGQNAPARLMRLRDKLTHLDKAGADYVICVKFDRQFSALPAQVFIRDWLVGRLAVGFLSLGDDFRFGAQRTGDFSLLCRESARFGFQVEENPTFYLGEQRVSSTAIRRALAENDLEAAELMLGRPYAITGRVAHGNKLGRTIGFPTANILLHRQVNPVHGVYAVKVRLKNRKFFYGVANIGRRPTINGVKQLLEVHLFDFNQDIYGQPLEVILCRHLRAEMKFPSFEHLKQQIARDVGSAYAFFSKKTL